MEEGAAVPAPWKKFSADAGAVAGGEMNAMDVEDKGVNVMDVAIVVAVVAAAVDCLAPD